MVFFITLDVAKIEESGGSRYGLDGRHSIIYYLTEINNRLILYFIMHFCLTNVVGISFYS